MSYKVLKKSLKFPCFGALFLIIFSISPIYRLYDFIQNKNHKITEFKNHEKMLEMLKNINF